MNTFKSKKLRPIVMSKDTRNGGRSRSGLGFEEPIKTINQEFNLFLGRLVHHIAIYYNAPSTGKSFEERSRLQSGKLIHYSIHYWIVLICS